MQTMQIKGKIMKKRIQDIINSAKESIIRGIKESLRRYRQFRTYVIERYRAFMLWHASLELRKQNRITLLIISLVLICDYFMICGLAGKNPASIFPSLPVLDFRDSVTIYLPSTEGLLKEKRLIEIPESNEEYISRLTRFVIEGSAFENTRIMTPIQGDVRKVWIYNEECYIDVRLETLASDAPIVAGSEKVFREALTKTITDNVKNVKKVLVLENGIPNKNLWESPIM
jgi:hypothetical protein